MAARGILALAVDCGCIPSVFVSSLWLTIVALTIVVSLGIIIVLRSVSTGASITSTGTASSTRFCSFFGSLHRCSSVSLDTTHGAPSRVTRLCH